MADSLTGSGGDSGRGGGGKGYAAGRVRVCYSRLPTRCPPVSVRSSGSPPDFLLPKATYIAREVQKIPAHTSISLPSPPPLHGMDGRTQARGLEGPLSEVEPTACRTYLFALPYCLSVYARGVLVLKRRRWIWDMAMGSLILLSLWRKTIISLLEFPSCLSLYPSGGYYICSI